MWVAMATGISVGRHGNKWGISMGRYGNRWQQISVGWYGNTGYQCGLMATDGATVWVGMATRWLLVWVGMATVEL